LSENYDVKTDNENCGLMKVRLVFFIDENLDKKEITIKNTLLNRFINTRGGT